MRIFFIVTVLLAALSAPIPAQTVTGTLEGRITDASGSSAPDAIVFVENDETG